MSKQAGATRDRPSRSNEQTRSPDTGSSPARGGPAGKVAAASERIVRGVLSPFGAVLITSQGIEEILDDAVRRGRMTRADAQDMIQSLLSRGARVTGDLLADVERLLGRGSELAPADPSAAEAAPGSAGADLPIPGYDDLSAAQVQDRLEGLSPSQLRRLRDYEHRNANRKTVLERIDRRLR
jgi:hypothetical protein